MKAAMFHWCPMLKLNTTIFITQLSVPTSLFYRKFYGNKVKEFVQGPGETIYMPVFSIYLQFFLLNIQTFQGHLAHAVMNIDENLSVTENLFLHDSLEDWVHG